MRDALAARGIKLAAERVIEKPYSLASGREGLRALMANARPPTAVMCGNDVLAIGAIAECNTLGIRVPQQVSITGFDDMEIASLLSPGLTTVHFRRWNSASSRPRICWRSYRVKASRASTSCPLNSRCAARPRRRPARDYGAPSAEAGMPGRLKRGRAPVEQLHLPLDETDIRQNKKALGVYTLQRDCADRWARYG